MGPLGNRGPRSARRFWRAITHGQDRFYIGGAGGEFFTTTDAGYVHCGGGAGELWRTSKASPRRRLTFGRGERRFLLATQTAGSWNVDPTGYNSTFRGVVARAPNEAAVVGEREAAVYKLGAWWRLESPPFLATAVCAKTETELVAVGFDGRHRPRGTDRPAFD